MRDLIATPVQSSKAQRFFVSIDENHIRLVA
jgi:hypothetical protein